MPACDADEPIPRKRQSTFSWWLTGFLVLLPVGTQLFAQVVIADLFLLTGLAGALLTTIRRSDLRVEPPDLFLLAFLGISLVGTDIPAFPEYYLWEVGIVCFLYLGSRVITRQLTGSADLLRAVRRFNLLFLPTLVILAIGYLLRNPEGIAPAWLFAESGRLRGTFRFSNQLSIYLLAAMPPAVGLGRFSAGWRFLWYALFIIVIGGVGSRGCMITGVLEVIALETFRPSDRKGWPAWARLLVVAGLLFGVGLAMNEDYYFRRATGGETRFPLTFDSERVTNFRRAANELEQVFTGVGLGCFQALFGYEVHNTMLSLLAETGVFGLLAFSLLMMTALPPLLQTLSCRHRVFREAGIFLVIAIGGLFLYGMTVNLLRSRFMWLVWGLARVGPPPKHSPALPAGEGVA